MTISLALAGLLLAVSAPLPSPPHWEWRGAANEIDIDLARADVRIVATRGAPAIRIVATGADAAAVAFSATPADGMVRIRDRYPPRGRWADECLPPVDERGDFWTYAVPLEVVISVPPGTRLRVRVMAGDIRASGASAGFDLQTASGVVQRGR